MNNQQLYVLSKELCGKKTVKDEIDKTYNKLVNLHNVIVSKGFEINLFPIKEQNAFLKEVLKLKEFDEDLLSTHTPNKKVPNRKIIYNLNKEDMELNKEELMDFFIEKGIMGNTFKPNLISFKDIALIDYQNKEIIKQSIRYSGENCTKSYGHPYIAITNYANSTDVEFNEFEKIGVKNLKQEILVTDLIEESYTYLFLQSIIYLIIKNPHLNKERRVKYLLNIEKTIEQVSCKEDLDCDLEYDNIFNSFAVYLSKILKRDQMNNYIRITTFLEKEIKDEPDLFRDVQEQYKCNQRWLEDIKTKKELMNIVLEGKQEKVERFNKKAEKCKKAIMILRNIAGRDLSEEYLQHFKVVYREIFLSRVKSDEKDGKNANTIVSDMINQVDSKLFSKYSDSIFLREKLSRGFFREDGLIEEYIIKNRIQRQLYTNLLLIYKSMDVKFQKRNIQTFYGAVFKEMMNIFKKIDKEAGLKE